MHPTMSWWRYILAADIVMHLIAIWWFAFLPPSTLNEYEKVIMALATFSAVGVFAHVTNVIRVPGEAWSYLLSGFVCVFTLLIYEIRTLGSEVPLSIRVPFGLFLLAGAMSSFAAHVIDGGPTRGVRGGK